MSLEVRSNLVKQDPSRLDSEVDSKRDLNLSGPTFSNVKITQDIKFT